MTKTTDVRETAAKTATNKKTAKNTEQVMYIGPSIHRVALRNTVYSNGISPMLKEFCEKNPSAKALIVPVSELAGALADLKRGDSAIAVCYETICDLKKEDE